MDLLGAVHLSGVAVCTHNPSTGEVEQGTVMGCAGCSLSLTVHLQASQGRRQKAGEMAHWLTALADFAEDLS